MEEGESRKTARTFAVASFLNDLGSDIIYPVWPIFVTTYLRANMAVLGLIDGLGDAVVAVSQALSGYLSDRLGKRKVFIWLGYLLAALSRVAYAFAPTWRYLIPFKVVDRLGKMRGAPRDAMVADASTKETRGRNFGLLRAMDNLGAVCGILVCMLLLETLGYRKLFLLAAAPSVVGAMLILALIREEKPPCAPICKGFAIRNTGRNFKLFLFLSALFALGSFSYSFLLVFAKRFGFKVGFVPVLYLLFTAVASVFSLPFGRLTDRIGRKPVLLISFGLWGLVCASMAAFQAQWAIAVSFVLYGLHKGAMEPSQKTLVSELAPAQYRASALEF